MDIKSKALAVNLADYHIDVAIEETYAPLQEIMSRYYGLMEGFNTFLKELSHPYKNWQFIVKEARGYALDYFHLFPGHPRGAAGIRLYCQIFAGALEAAENREIKADAADNLLLYLQKVVQDSGATLAAMLPVLDDVFDRIAACPDPLFFLFARSYYRLERLAGLMLGALPAQDTGFEAINRLLVRYFDHTFRFWQGEADPAAWLAKEAADVREDEVVAALVERISHRRIAAMRRELEALCREAVPGSRNMLAQLLTLKGYPHFIRRYQELPAALEAAGAPRGQGRQLKLFFLFHIMHVPGLAAIHEETLREINRVLSWIIRHEDPSRVYALIRKTAAILKEGTDRYPGTALDCLLNMGKGVFATDDIDLVNYFINQMIDLGFQFPQVDGVGNDWQVRVKSAHLQNIRTWLEIIGLNPKRSTRLLSALMINLSLGGVYIKDTDLFPREITRLLNSGIRPVYYLVKQLAKRFPVYFNDIGAEGELRDISTRLDEVCQRKDRLIHFLRKQSHVESSNRIVDFMKAALVFWETRDKRELKPFVPPAIYEQIREEGPFVDGVHQVMQTLKAQGVHAADPQLLAMDPGELAGRLQEAAGIRAGDLERVALAIRFYQLLNHKYTFGAARLADYLAQLRAEAFPRLELLEAALAEPDLKQKVGRLLDYLNHLKDLILSERIYEARENIYKKRHFTVDIPSMYGYYHETKFDALGLSFRIESLVNVHFETLVHAIDLSLITKATFFQIFDLLRLFERALKIDGISSVEFERQLDLLAHSLEVRGFTFTQYLDIFKGFAQAVKNIINDHIINIHKQNLARILEGAPPDRILSKYLPRGREVDPEKLTHRIGEILSREIIAGSLGLQQLDLLLSRILNTLFYQAEQLCPVKLHMLLGYDPERAITRVGEVKKRIASIVYLGNKGFNMVKLNSFGLPVPPGFIISTEVFRSRQIIEGYLPAASNFKEQLAREIAFLERVSGRRFGNPRRPLLLSVRSGASISQPGMMDTFLDVGINEEIAAGIAAETGNAWFAWDNYRRFLQSCGMSLGILRDDFDALMNRFKRRWGIPLKREFSGAQMKTVAFAYKALLADHGIALEEHPFEQLYATVQRVLGSWESPKAKTYRRIMGISDDWGTAVTVQQMVFGNLSPAAGSGVIFTHNPQWSEESLRLWGDFTLQNQGEDVVSGLVRTLPVSVIQRDTEKRDTPETLETHFAGIYQALKGMASDLVERRGWSPQEMEFTFESPDPGDLYLLQTRDMGIRERKKEFSFDREHIPAERLIGHGIGVSGGALSGRVVFTLGDIERWRALEPGTPLILVRGDTVPDDIREIFAADGLLTARGGVTSHAAVVAHRLNKTCVVGCQSLSCDEREKTCRFVGVSLKAGDHISIDGHEGSVYQGMLKVRAM